MIKKLIPNSAVIRSWVGLVGKTSGAQIVIQGIGFICGIAIIRYLSTEQYAYYTIANSMLAAITILTDSGISAGVTSESGKIWQNKEELGKVLATGIQLRKSFAVFSLCISIPALFYLLDTQGLEWWQSLGLVAAMLPVFWATLTGSILQIVPKLHQDVDELLKINLSANGIRLALTFLTLLIFPLASLAIVATGMGQVYTNFQLRKLSTRNADWKVESDPVYKARIMKVVKRVVPGTIYYAVAGQLTVWLVSAFNDTDGVADIGALSRIMAVLVILRMTLNLLVIPRFARLTDDKSLLLKRFGQIIGLVAILATGIVSAIYIFPEPVLYVLGDNYANLEYELFLISISSCLSMIGEIIYQLTSSRGIIANPLYFIPTMIAAQVITIFFLVDVTTVVGVISFSMVTISVSISYQIVYFLATLLKRN